MRITKDNIFEEAEKSNLEVLRSDLVDQVKDEDGWTPLHWLADKKVKETLDHPSVDKVKDRHGWTPFHLLAWEGVKEVLNHPSVDKIKKDGWTPLHFLAWNGVKSVLNHPSVDQVKDNNGLTPLYYLTRWNHFTVKDLRKKYPWYKKEIKNIEEAVKEIENTPDSIRFILED